MQDLLVLRNNCIHINSILFITSHFKKLEIKTFKSVSILTCIFDPVVIQLCSCGCKIMDRHHCQKSNPKEIKEKLNYKRQNVNSK